MIVELIAHTVVTGWGVMRDAGWQKHDHPDYSRHWKKHDSDELAEFAGRLCYQSWDRPNPATATNEGYLAHILEVEHTSVLEHASATFYVEGVSRSLLMELRTHRHLSFSALSQRYVDESNAVAVIPPAVEKADADEVNGLLGSRVVGAAMNRALEAYDDLVRLLTQTGKFTRKQAREAARSVLPNAVATKFVVSGNLWAWRYVLKKRVSPGADAEMQLLAREMLRQLTEIAPNTFQGM